MGLLFYLGVIVGMFIFPIAYAIGHNTAQTAWRRENRHLKLVSGFLEGREFPKAKEYLNENW